MAFIAAFAAGAALQSKIPAGSDKLVNEALASQFSAAMSVARILMRDGPYVGGIVTIWLALARPMWRERLLWGAALIFSSTWIVSNTMQAFLAVNANVPGAFYPSGLVVMGTLSYAVWFLVVTRSAMAATWRRIFGALFALAAVASIALPLFLMDARWIDVVGGVLLAGALFSLGVFFAELMNVDLFGRKVSK